MNFMVNRNALIVLSKLLLDASVMEIITFLVLGGQKEIKIPPEREIYSACFSSVG